MSTISDFIADADLRSFFFDLADAGWFHYVFPFLLVYALVLTILNRVEIFQKNKAVRIVIAAIFGIFAIAFPISEGPCGSPIAGNFGITNGCTIGDLMISLFPGVTAFSIGILALYIVAAMLGVDLMSFLGKDESNQQVMRYILGFIGLIFVIFYFGLGYGWWDNFNSNFWLFEILRDPLLYIIIIFALLFFWISGEDGDSSRKDNANVVIDQRRQN